MFASPTSIDSLFNFTCEISRCFETKLKHKLKLRHLSVDGIANPVVWGHDMSTRLNRILNGDPNQKRGILFITKKFLVRTFAEMQGCCVGLKHTAVVFGGDRVSGEQFFELRLVSCEEHQHHGFI